MATTNDSRPNPPPMTAPTRKPAAGTFTTAGASPGDSTDVTSGTTGDPTGGGDGQPAAATNALRTRATPPARPPAAQDLGRYLRTEASAPADAPPPGASANGSADYNADGSIRDMEKSLVERIADVDDDRRRTATQLQKAFNTHRDETRAEVRRWRLGLSFVLALWVLLLVAGLGGLAWQAEQRHQALRADLAALERRLTPPPAAGDDQAMRGGDSELAARLADLEPGLAQASTSIAALEHAVDTLRTSVRTSDALTPEDDAAVAISAQFASRLDAFETEQHRLATQLGELATAQQEQLQASAPATLPIDALIDQQLSRLEREYQRLAQQVTSAAVAPASDPDAAGQDPDDAPDPPPGAGADPAGEGDGEGAGEPGSVAAPATGPTETETEGAPEGTSDIGAGAGNTPEAGSGEATGAIERVGERSFALQLIGFHSRADLDAFCARNPLPVRVYTREEVFRDRPWHVLIHSLHPDLEAATNAMSALPAALSGLDLWIRSLSADDKLEVITPPPQ